MEVQPYAFTTKALYVGHTDYKYLRWQVIDTPGILDRPLEERNTIEMQSVTALAHLRAAVLYVVDVSEQCGYTIAQQAALFHSIKPLFSNKPVLIVANKTDARKLEDLPAADLALVHEMGREAGRVGAGAAAMASGAGAATLEETLISMSALTEDGVARVKALACDRLLASRVEVKLKSRRVDDVVGRIHVAMPRQRDARARPAVIPAGVAEARARRDAGERRRTERDLQEEHGGAGVYTQGARAAPVRGAPENAAPPPPPLLPPAMPSPSHPLAPPPPPPPPRLQTCASCGTCATPPGGTTSCPRSSRATTCWTSWTQTSTPAWRRWSGRRRRRRRRRRPRARRWRRRRA